MNHEDRLAKAENTCMRIASYLEGIEGVDVEVQKNTIGHDPHGVRITLTRSDVSLLQVQENLKNGTPRIWMRCDQDMQGNFDGTTARISPFGLYEGEADIVGKRLAEEINNL